MNTVFAPPSNGDVGRQTGYEMSSVWQGVGSASPRDHLEFGAKLLGFSGEVGDYAALPDQLAAPRALALAEERASTPVSACAVTLDVIYVRRGNMGSRGVLPPRDSIEWERLVARRIGYISAAFALASIATSLIWVVRELPRIESGWMAGLIFMALMAPALYGLFFLVIDAVYGLASGATGRAKKYMDQVYPRSLANKFLDDV